TRAHRAVDRHIGHGSHEVIRVQPSREKVPSALQAARIAVTSACADGSFSAVTWLCAVATTAPSLTIRAPKGPPPLFALSVATAMACCIHACSSWTVGAVFTVMV